MLSEKGFVQGSTVTMSVYSSDVGMINSIRLIAKEVEMWKPDQIIISRGD